MSVGIKPVDERVLIEPRDHAWHFGAMLLGREAYDPEEVKRHWRAWIIKGFFGAGAEDVSRSEPFEFTNGEPAVLLGNNEGANPVEFLLHALAGCVTTTFVLHAAARLGGLWRLLGVVGSWVPRRIRDSVYDFISRHRKRWKHS